MPIKVFEKHAGETSLKFEGRVNEWAAKLAPNAVKNIAAAPTQGGVSLGVVIWYEGRGLHPVPRTPS